MGKTAIYLNFANQTEAAFEFYKKVFQSAFNPPGIVRFKDMPPQEGMPPISEAIQNLVMHVELPIMGGTILMGTDAPAEMGFEVKMGNNMYISISPDTKEDATNLFHQLSEGGSVTMDLQDTFWGAYFGSCIDRFGIQWMVNYDYPKV